MYLEVAGLAKDRKVLSFARCLIQLDVSAALPTSVELHLPKNKVVQQSILYEQMPTYCSNCKRLGHDIGDCHVSNAKGPYVPKSSLQKTGHEKATVPVSATTQALVVASGNAGVDGGFVNMIDGNGPVLVAPRNVSHSSGLAQGIAAAVGNVGSAGAGSSLQQVDGFITITSRKKKKNRNKGKQASGAYSGSTAGKHMGGSTSTTSGTNVNKNTGGQQPKLQNNVKK